jgi:DNA-binding GntR family transcriptional regulator
MIKALPRPHSSAADQLAASIREGIRRGDFVPGQRLAEADLAARFKVSRPVVREALRELTADGIVDAELYRGARVHQFTRGECDQIYAVREMLEGLAARLCAENIGQNGRKQIETIMKDMRAAVKHKNSSAYLEANIKFHSLIAEVSGNNYLEQLLTQLQLPLFRLIYGRLINEDEVLRSMGEHDEIADAILRGRVKAAESAMRRHIHIAGRRLLSVDSRFFRP